MPITVRTGAALRRLLGGQPEAQALGATVGEVLDHLAVRDRICDGSGKVRRHFNIHVNEGEDIRLLQGLDTPVRDGDTVTILSAIAGGDGAAPLLSARAAEARMPQTTCPVTGGKINKTLYVDHGGKRIYACCRGCLPRIREDPAQYIQTLETSGVTLERTP